MKAVYYKIHNWSSTAYSNIKERHIHKTKCNRVEMFTNFIFNKIWGILEMGYGSTKIVTLAYA